MNIAVIATVLGLLALGAAYRLGEKHGYEDGYAFGELHGSATGYNECHEAWRDVINDYRKTHAK